MGRRLINLNYRLGNYGAYCRLVCPKYCVYELKMARVTFHQLSLVRPCCTVHSPQKIYYEVYLRILKKWKFTLKMRTGQALRYWADEVGSRARNNGKMSVKSSSQLILKTFFRSSFKKCNFNIV